MPGLGAPLNANNVAFNLAIVLGAVIGIVLSAFLPAEWWSLVIILVMAVLVACLAYRLSRLIEPYLPKHPWRQ